LLPHDDGIKGGLAVATRGSRECKTHGQASPRIGRGEGSYFQYFQYVQEGVVSFESWDAKKW
jgi:hypothetical protein